MATMSPAPAAMVMPLVPATRIDPKVPLQLRVIALVMVIPPNPPGSRQSISPAAAVLEIAPAKVLQGAVRLQGLASSPTPETQVLVAWAFAGTANRVAMIIAGIMASSMPIFMKNPLQKFYRFES